MAVTLHCPDNATLLRLFGQGGSHEEMESLARHVEQCTRCGERIDEMLRKDEVSLGLAKPVDGTDMPDSEALLNLRRRLQQLRPPASSENTADAVGTHSTSASGSPFPAALPMNGADLGITFLAPPQAPDEIGRLGPYRVLKKLGAGGMGMVLLAEDAMLKRKVALKVMLPNIAVNPQARERFLREARAAAAIEHQHIITIHQVGEDHGVPFLAMPLLKGESLDDRLKREKKLPINEAVRITCEMADGLAAAHAQGLIHRDIKPGNVWLEEQAVRAPAAGAQAAPSVRRPAKVKVLDFGLARSQAEEVQLTQSGAIVGTPAFMAPEQARGLPVDARADLFSLGCVLYVMLTGKRPFTGESTMALLTALALDTPKSPRELNPAVPAVLSAFTMRLLAKKPEDRPASADAALDELRNMIRAAAAAKKAAAPSPHSTAPKTAIQPAPSQPEPRPKKAPARPPRRRVALLIGLALLFLIGGGFAAYQLLFKTNDGTLIVNVDGDADVRFKRGELHVMDADGKLLYTLKPSEKNKTLPPGKYLIEVAGVDGLKLNTDQFEIIRNGKATVRVTVAAAKKDDAAVAPKGGAGAAAPGEITNSIGMKLKLIRPGAFIMGSSKDEEGRFDDEATQPQHEVEISKAFYMGVYPVTKGQFTAFAKETGYQTVAEKDGKGGLVFNTTTGGWEQKPEYTWRHPGFPQGEDHPVVDVAWNDAQAFCAWLSKKEGKTFELPTEAEWEYACRAGTKTRFWCGDADASLQGNANIADASLQEKSPAAGWAVAWDDGYAFTAPVGTFKANPWGLYDMGGNVFQWCADGWAAYPDGSVKDPKGPDNGDSRVLRGCSWASSARMCRSAMRHCWPNHRSDDLGFRVVLRFPASQPLPQAGEAAKPPVDDAWIKQVAALPAEKQVEAVAAKLKELNPGFDGKVRPLIEDGAVVEFGFFVDYVSDVSPVQALKELRTLYCTGSAVGKGRLRDLSPLRSMKLTTLFCDFTKVVDLSPLKDMKLTILFCADTKVSDLSPLRDLKLTKLWCCYSQVSDLSPLRDMKMTGLDLTGTHVVDLSPLQNMKLTILRCGNTQVSDLSPLRDMPLQILLLDHTRVTDLSLLRGMPLKELYCDFDSKRDADILRSIKTLETINGKPAAEFWKDVDAAVKAAKKDADADRKAAEYVLSIGGTVEVAVAVNDPYGETKAAAADLPQKPFRLMAVRLSENKQVSDAGLACFKDCKNVTILDLRNTQVSDACLAHFKNCKNLRNISLDGTQITNACVADLKDWKKLLFLGLGWTRVSNSGLVHLKDCKNLEQIFLGGGEINDASLSLFNCETLTALGLDGTNVSDEGLAYLKDNKIMYSLTLVNMKVSDAGLENLKGLGALTILDLTGSKVTAAGVKKLAAALPKCKITWDGGVIEPKP